MVMNRLLGIVALSVVAGALSACARGEARPYPSVVLLPTQATRITWERKER